MHAQKGLRICAHIEDTNLHAQCAWYRLDCVGHACWSLCIAASSRATTGRSSPMDRQVGCMHLLLCESWPIDCAAHGRHFPAEN
eukprot:908495-Pleurochrysis_carterae.AAC.1